MFRSAITALALLAAPAAFAQDSALEPVDFMIRPSQDSVPSATAGNDDIWAPLDMAGNGDPGFESAPNPAEGTVAATIEAPAQPAAPRREEDATDPFEAVGVHLGTFVIRPSLEIGVSATDNADGEEDGEAAAGLIAAPAVSVRSDWSRHAVEADAEGRLVHYGDDSIDVREGSARLFGRYDIGSRTAVDAEIAYQRDLDTYSDPDTPTDAAQRPTNHSAQATVGVTHRFNRVSVRLGGEAERETHDEVALSGGGTDTREDLDFLRTGVRARVAVEAGPALTPFVEAAAGRKDFDEAVDASGFRRSSRWGELRGGLLVDLGAKTQGEVSVGYYREDLEDAQLEDLGGVVASAALLWSPRRLTTVRFDFATDVSPTSLAGASGSFIYSGRATVTRQLRHRLRLEAGLGIDHERFVGADLRETTVSGFGGVSYALSRWASLQARYEHERTDSTVPGSDAVVNTVSVRLRLQR